MSPEVWQCSRDLIVATATDLGVPVELPNEDFNVPPPPSIWVSIDMGGEASQTMELSNVWWRETGSVWVHTMVPLNGGIMTALQYRKAFSVAFRANQPNVEGLNWIDHSFDPMTADDGLWRRLTLVVRYTFDEKLGPSQTAAAAFSGGGRIG